MGRGAIEMEVNKVNQEFSPEKSRLKDVLLLFFSPS